MAGSFLTVPMSEFRGWYCMAFFMIFVFSCMGLSFPAHRKPNTTVDSAPLVLFGMFALWLSVRPLDNIGGLFSLFTMSFSVAMAAYKLTVLSTLANQ